MKKDDHLDIESAKEFVEEYCRPLPEAEAQAKEAAWVIYQELQKCREETKQVEDKEEEETVVEETEVTSQPETKVKGLKPKNSSKSYIQFVKEQVKVIGMAGTIAMSTAVYSQSQAVATHGAIVYKVVEKEIPLLMYIRELATGAVPFSLSNLINYSTASYKSLAASKGGSATSSSNTPKAAATAAVKAVVGDKATAVDKTETAATEEKASIADVAAVDPSVPEVKSLLEEGKKLTDKQDSLLMAQPPENPVPPVINPPHVTNPNP